MAYDFDGSNDKIALGDIAIDGLTQFYLSAWANFDVLSDYDPIFSKGDDAGTNLVNMALGGVSVGDNNEIAASIKNGSSSSYGYTIDNDLVATGAWNHWFMGYEGGGATDADRLKLFFNGAQKTLSFGGGGIPATMPTNADVATIGSNSTAASNWMNGKVAELAIWTAGTPGGMAAASAAALLAKGYSPNFLRKNGLHYYPLVRDAKDHWAGNTGTITEAAPFAHPRIIMTRKTKWAEFVPVTLFYMRPDADDVDGTWTTETGGTTLFASIDEPTVDDADYIKSAETPQNDICRVRISDPTATPDEPFKVRYRYKKTGGDTVDLIVRLKEGTTTRASWTHSNVGTDFTTVTQTLSSGEFASITDFTNLFVEFEADTP